MLMEKSDAGASDAWRKLTEAEMGDRGCSGEVPMCRSGKNGCKNDVWFSHFKSVSQLCPVQFKSRFWAKEDAGNHRGAMGKPSIFPEQSGAPQTLPPQ